MYKGLALPDMLANGSEAFEALQAVPAVDLRSWRQAPPLNSYLWTVKPPGDWAVLMRVDEFIVTTNPGIPLYYDVGPDAPMAEVRWDKIYGMLGRHKASLLCRVSEPAGLIAVASARPDGPWLPLMPGYRVTLEGPVPAEFEKVAAQVKGKLEEDKKEWPEGLQEPMVIHMSSIQGLSVMEHRDEWLSKYPEGIWLLSVQEGRMNVFEVLS